MQFIVTTSCSIKENMTPFPICNESEEKCRMEHGGKMTI